MVSEETERLRDEAEQAELEDFEAFWAQQKRPRVGLRNVFGVDVVLPPALPLSFEIEAYQLQQADSDEATRRMVAILFGEDALNTWIEGGMDPEQLGVLLLWGAQNADGNRMTLAEARTEYLRRKQLSEGEQGKATDAANGGSSPEGGDSSSRTSDASTASQETS